MERKLHKVKLYGSLAKDYGSMTIEVYAKDLKEIFRALSSRFGEHFKTTIINNAWHITKGKRKSTSLKKNDSFISTDEVDLPLLDNEIHIFPAIIGAGGKGAGIGAIVLGIVLIAIAVVAVVYTGGAAAGLIGAIGSTAGQVALVGLGAVAFGVSALLAQSPTTGDYSSQASGADAKQSFIFNGAVNNTEQGVPVPLVYGRHLVGSTVISAGLDVEQLDV